MAWLDAKEAVERYKRLLITLYGKPGVGKTYALLQVAKKEPVFFFSADTGLREISKGGKFRIRVSYEREKKAVLKDIATVRKLIEGKIAKGEWEPGKVWIVVDTITYLAHRMLLDILRRDGKGSSGDGTAQGSPTAKDLAQQTDWGVLAAWITEVADALLWVPANIVFVGLEATDDVTKEPTLRAQGSGRDHILGLSDVIARMVIDDAGKRILALTPAAGMGQARVRGGGVAPTQPANLLDLRDQLLASNEAGATSTEGE